MCLRVPPAPGLVESAALGGGLNVGRLVGELANDVFEEGHLRAGRTACELMCTRENKRARVCMCAKHKIKP